MMQKLFLLFAFALSCVTAQAEVLVYKLRVTQTDTGQGGTIKTNFTGYAVFTGSKEVGFIAGDNKSKRYRKFIPASGEPANVYGPRGTLSAFRISDESEFFGGLRAVGNDTRNTPLGKVAPSLKVTGTELDGRGELALYHVFTYAGSFSYDAKKTAEFNEMNMSLGACLGMLETEMLDKNFLPF